MERLLRADEASEVLNVSRSTLYRLVKAGLPAVKLAKDLRFRPADLEAWLDGRKVAAR